MNKFMANIRLEGLDMDTRMKLLPAEQEGVKVLEEKGVLLHSFIKQEGYVRNFYGDGGE